MQVIKKKPANKAVSYSHGKELKDRVLGRGLSTWDRFWEAVSM